MLDQSYIGLGEEAILQMKAVNCLKRIGYKPITYKNAFPLRNWEFLSGGRVNYIQDIVVSRDTAKNRMGRKEAIHIITDIGQVGSYLQAENNFDYLIWEGRL